MAALEVRARADAARRRTLTRLAGLGVAVILLLTVYSGGFFLYAALVLAAMGGLSWGLSSAGRATATRTIDKQRLEEGEVVRVAVTLKNEGGFPTPWLFWEDRVDGGLTPSGVSCAMLGLGAGGEERFEYTLPARRRGLYRVGPALTEVSGPFGLVRRVRLGEDATFLTVLPRPVALGAPLTPADRPVREIPRRRSLFEDPSRFAGIREFRVGDSLRRVHWRATARAGRLQSRVFEPAVLGGILLAVEMDAAVWGPAPDGGDGAHPLVELAVTTAASLVDHVLGSGQSVGLFSNGGDAAERYPADWSGETFRRRSEAVAGVSAKDVRRLRPVSVSVGKGTWQRERLRTALARLVPSEGMTLPELLVAELPRMPRSVVLGVVTPRMDEALAAALGAYRRAGFEITVIWLKGGGEARVKALPGVAVYPVRDRASLRRLGAVRL